MNCELCEIKDKSECEECIYEDYYPNGPIINALDYNEICPDAI